MICKTNKVELRMRIITAVPEGQNSTLEGEDVRPTTDRVKQALFNIVQFQIEGRNVLDLFAGSDNWVWRAAAEGKMSFW